MSSLVDGGALFRPLVGAFRPSAGTVRIGSSSWLLPHRYSISSLQSLLSKSDDDKDKSPQQKSKMINNIEEEEIRDRKLPWLILSSPTKPKNLEKPDQSHYLFDFTQMNTKKKKIKIKIPSRQLYLPQGAGHSFIGCSQGYLFTVDHENLDIHATNPLTGAQIPLPPTASFPFVCAVEHHPSSCKISSYVIKRIYNDYEFMGIMETEEDEKLKINSLLYEDSRGKTTSLILGLDEKKHDRMSIDCMRYFYENAILSPSMDTAAVLIGCCRGGKFVAVARVGEDGGGGGDDEDGVTLSSSLWTPLMPEAASGFSSIIFHEGRLHAVDHKNNLVIFEKDFSHLLIPRLGSLEDAVNETCTSEYLVESPDGHDLFLVFRDCYDEKWPARTNIFKVFKLDKKNNYRWEKVQNIGDLAFFVGSSSYSMSFSALDFPPGLLKPNCIYFTDSEQSYAPHNVGDSGIFHLEDGRIEKFYCGIYNFNSQPPIWFMPNHIR